MKYSDCPLYGLQSKKMLKRLLHIEDSKLTKQDYIASLVSPYIDKSGKPRLIEPPSEELKAVQKRLKNLLNKIVVPDNVFSGVKGRSYADNARMHIGNGRRNLFKIYLTAFFPSIDRETVYRFFVEDLNCSSDVAQILTNLTTIDLDKAKISNRNEVYLFLSSKKVTTRNHLISGAPTSQIMSYLVNHQMFDEMQALSDRNNIFMTVYVDDVTFSSEHWISHKFTEQIHKIIKKYKYKISSSKVKKCTKLYPKVVTGVVIDANGNAVIKNAMRHKIINEYNQLLQNPNDTKCRQRLRGLLTAARQVNRHAFPTIYKFAFESS